MCGVVNRILDGDRALADKILLANREYQEQQSAFEAYMKALEEYRRKHGR